MPYNRRKAKPITKLNALTITAGEDQTHDYYMTIGPMFADPVARQLYAEIASIEEQHVTQYESLTDPEEPLLEKWLLHEAAEVYNYLSCLTYESDARIKEIWQRCLEYELGQGARLYQMLLQKHAASGAKFPGYGEWNATPLRKKNHFVLLQNAIFEFGGDPTAITPAADVTAVISSGVLKVIADPRTTMPQSLKALLTAELVDNDSWEI